MLVERFNNFRRRVTLAKGESRRAAGLKHAQNAFKNRLRRIGANETVPSKLYQFDPLGFVSKRCAGHLVEKCLLLNTAGICGDQMRLPLEHHHVEVSDGIDDEKPFFYVAEQ